MSLAGARHFSPDKLQKVPLVDSPYLFFDLYCLEDGQEQKVHAHAESDKVYLTLEGAPTVQIGHETAVLSAGEAVLAPAGEPHGVKNLSGERAVLLVAMAPRPS